MPEGQGRLAHRARRDLCSLTVVPDLHRTDWQQENYDVLRFGYEKYAGPDADIWFDDLAVGNERIGCFP